MRPSVLPHNSMARSTAQSDGLELSTGTKISRYTSTSLWAGEYVNDETGCQVSGGTSCLPSESQTVMASTGQASHARSRRSRSTRSGSRNVAMVSASNLKPSGASRSEEHTSELQSQSNLVCRLLLEKKKKIS